MSFELKSNQWLGIGKGANHFHTVMLDLDDEGEKCIGSFFAFEADQNLPSVYGKVELDKFLAEQSVTVEITPLDPKNCDLVSHNRINDIWPEASMSKTANLKFFFSTKGVVIGWDTPKGLKGRCELASFSNAASEVPKMPPEVMSWTEFKRKAQLYEYRKYVFRGQAQPWQLATSFHRTRRKDLVKYIQEDIPLMFRNLSPYIEHLLDYDNKEHVTAMYHLLQHHGYPTPMLDWSYSPYIASFFGLDSWENERVHPEPFVRIFVFDLESWNSNVVHKNSVTFCMPFISFFEPLPIANNRTIPQQGLSMATNLFGVENYIKFVETETGNKYLSAIDIPVEELPEAIVDLRRMGITKGSLFPGLDGIC